LFGTTIQKSFSKTLNKKFKQKSKKGKETKKKKNERNKKREKQTIIKNFCKKIFCRFRGDFLEKFLSSIVKDLTAQKIHVLKKFTDVGGKGHLLLGNPLESNLPKLPSENSRKLEKVVDKLVDKNKSLYEGLKLERVEFKKHPWAFHPRAKTSKTGEKVRKPVSAFDVFLNGEKILTLLPNPKLVWRQGHFIIHKNALDNKQAVETVKKIISSFALKRF